MKHSLKVTGLLLLIFLLSQYIGLGLLYLTIDQIKTHQTGKTEFKELAFTERPQFEEQTSYIPIIISVIIGTIIILGLIKFKLIWIWKIWYTIAIITTLSISLGVLLIPSVAITIAVIFGLWKIFKPNVYIHNFTELLIYPAIALIFVPVLNLFSITMLLILISIYDAYAVWKSKHMITLAESQKQSKLFAGLLIPYSPKTNTLDSKSSDAKPSIQAKSPIHSKSTVHNEPPIPSKSSEHNESSIPSNLSNHPAHKSSSTEQVAKVTSQINSHKTTPHEPLLGIPKQQPLNKAQQNEEPRTAILGGGDIAFPLLFTGVILKVIGIHYAILVPIFTTIALALLFLKSKPGKYYPAMPFISLGCLTAYGIILIIKFLH